MCQNASYVALHGEFAHTSASRVAPSSTLVLPASVLKNARNIPIPPASDDRGRSRVARRRGPAGGAASPAERAGIDHGMAPENDSRNRAGFRAVIHLPAT
ncbi:hypothetical protein GCM10010149_65820 [Nonomuraea roseoviolacea subsp. roseoviolacea]